MNNNEILEGSLFSPHVQPKKLFFILHGYGDNADNFIHVAATLNLHEWEANYIALNAPSPVPNYPAGRQWFNLYPNGIYISEAGKEEISIIRSEVQSTVKQIKQTIIITKNKFKLSFRDCFIIGFSQGGIMTFELGNNLQHQLGGLAIISGRIMENKLITNNHLLNTPFFISHGNQDDVLPVKNFYDSCEFLETNHFTYEKYLLSGDTHTISPQAIDLLQKFIKKNL